ncbi:hypothetical protein HY989_06595 [Candidatus Micrarchaeota archaeon]|nr:hypothetical protein [Candidatus Micrarchaeota archaeon]
MGQVKELMRAYKVAHKYREEWYNIKWRGMIVLLSTFFIGFIYWYLGSQFGYYVQQYDFFLSDKLFHWFMIGSLFGIISIGMIFEGEFFLGLRNIAKELSHADNEVASKKGKNSRKKNN